MVPTNASWTSVDHNEKKGHVNHSSENERVNTFEKRANELSSQVLPASDYKQYVPVTKK